MHSGHQVANDRTLLVVLRKRDGEAKTEGGPEAHNYSVYTLTPVWLLEANWQRAKHDRDPSSRT